MHNQTLRETKLVFREPAVGRQLCETIANSPSLFGYSCLAQAASSFTDTYYSTWCDRASRDKPLIRQRRFEHGQTVWHSKSCALGQGNEWVYSTVSADTPEGLPKSSETGINSASPCVSIRVRRTPLEVHTLPEPLTLSIDFCVYCAPNGDELGQEVELEIKAAQGCTAFDHFVESMRHAFGLVVVHRPKYVRALEYLASQSGNRRKVILDVDPGVDDAIAILLALASPELEVMAITTVAGNVGLDQTTRNARLVVDAARRLYHLKETPPVSMGLTPAGSLPDASDVHGVDGLGGYSSAHTPETPLCDQPAPKLIADVLRRYPKEVSIISTGPLTNLAACVREHPSELTQAAELIAMGGVFFQEGNRMPSAEFNVHRDPASASEVVSFARQLSSDRNSETFPLTFVGLDVTHLVRLFRDDLGDESRASALLREISGVYMDFYRRNEGLDGCYLHDPLAVALAIKPALCERGTFHVEVETDGQFTSGATIADNRPTRLFGAYDKRKTHVCLTVDAAAAREFILGRVLGAAT